MTRIVGPGPPRVVINFIIIILVNATSRPVAAGGAVGIQSKYASVEDTYKKAVKAYTDERWTECIKQFEEVIHLNKLFNSVIANCRLKCNELVFEPLVEDKIDDLKVYELYLRKTECLLNCQRSGFQNVHLSNEISREVSENLESLKPYEYLHYCYHRMNLMPKAASAVHTYLVVNPDNAPMKQNYKYYLNQPEVDENEVIDLESDDYKLLHRQGVAAYDSGRWGETVANMEEAVLDYLASENKCRMYCEGPYDQGWLPDLATNIANHYTYVLQCKQKCQRALKTLDYDSGVSFLADVLNYIQIAYYHLDRVKEAARAVESYLLLLPNDEDMVKNKEIYSSIVDASAFSVRPDIVYYLKRDTYEKKLIHFVHTHFGFEINGVFQYESMN